MDNMHVAIASACERLIWIVIDNDLDRDVRLEINRVVEELKEAISK